jgi:hypothetical protein
MGHHPAIENGAGEVVVTQSSCRATPQSTNSRMAVASAAAVAADLVGRERRHRVNGQPGTTATTEGTVEQLRSATGAALPVRIVYVNADGSRAERELAPLDLSAGVVRAVDRDSAQIVTIPLARIASVVPASRRP